MDTLNDISPYWLGDPTVADDALALVAGMTLGEGEADRGLVYTLPSCPIPVVTPTGAGSERTRLAGLFTLPYPYLPATIWMRRPGEPMGAYQMRLVVALDALRLIQRGGDGHVWFTPLEDAPKDEAQVLEYANRFDGVGESAGFDRMRDMVRGRAREAWPHGYPVADHLILGRRLAQVGMLGSVVLAAQRAVAYGREGDELAAHAVLMLKRMRAQYGPLFDPEGMDPAQVAKWVLEHADDALAMLRELADLGLESPDTVKAAEGVLK